jgi:D-aspartate ligase
MPHTGAPRHPSGHHRPSSRPPILLGNASWTGTLAAVRSLGRAGVPVVVTEDRYLPPSRFSRHVHRFVRSPAFDGDGFIPWLLAHGAEEPGSVLYPTSDSLTYLYALHAEALGRVYRMSLSPLESIVSVLDKKLLYANAAAAGVPTPETWFPETREDLEKIAAEATTGLVVKPRTQILSQSMGKGAIVTDPSQLVAAYDDVLHTNHFGRALVDRYPAMARPMVQAYHPGAANEIYLLAGYVDDAKDLFAVRASLKILQWPRRLGIGLCFENAEVDTELAQGVRRLCKRAGYHGLYQIEFIRSGGRHLLIDFNPRFYHPLAFEVARGLELPLMVYAAACGDEDRLRELVLHAARPPSDRYTAFCNGFGFRLMLAAQKLSGTMPAEQVDSWRRWYAARDGRRIDSVADLADPLPSVAYAADELYRCARHPRAFYRGIALDR